MSLSATGVSGMLLLIDMDNGGLGWGKAHLFQLKVAGRFIGRILARCVVYILACWRTIMVWIFSPDTFGYPTGVLGWLGIDNSRVLGHLALT